MNIGKSVVIKGELSGSEDLTIEGNVEGKIELKRKHPHHRPQRQDPRRGVRQAVIVLGEVTGNVTASEKVDIRDNGSVDGDITSPRVAIAEGAHFRGSVDMQRAGAKPAAADGGAATTAPPRRPARGHADACAGAGPEGRRLTTQHDGGLRSHADGSVVASWGTAARPIPAPAAVTPSATTETRAQSIPPRRCRSSSRRLQARENRCCSIWARSSAATSSFFGEQLGCRIRVEDIAADIEAHIEEGHARPARRRSSGRGSRSRRARWTASSCWDVFDYLDRSAGAGAGRRADAAAAARRRAARVLQHRRNPEQPLYTKYVVVDPRHLRYRPIPRAAPRQREPAAPATSSGCSRACASRIRS